MTSVVSEHDGAIEHSTRNPVSTFLRKTFNVGRDTQRVSNALTLVCAATNSALVARIRPTVPDDEESATRNSTALRRGGGTRAGHLT